MIYHIVKCRDNNTDIQFIEEFTQSTLKEARILFGEITLACLIHDADRVSSGRYRLICSENTEGGYFDSWLRDYLDSDIIRDLPAWCKTEGLYDENNDFIVGFNNSRDIIRADGWIYRLERGAWAERDEYRPLCPKCGIALIRYDSHRSNKFAYLKCKKCGVTYRSPVYTHRLNTTPPHLYRVMEGIFRDIIKKPGISIWDWYPEMTPLDTNDERIDALNKLGFDGQSFANISLHSIHWGRLFEDIRETKSPDSDKIDKFIALKEAVYQGVIQNLTNDELKEIILESFLKHLSWTETIWSPVAFREKTSSQVISNELFPIGRKPLKRKRMNKPITRLSKPGKPLNSNKLGEKNT